MSDEDERGFAIERTGVMLIIALAVIVAPATMLASVWVLTHGFAFAQASRFELIMAGLSCLLALYVIYIAVRELAGGLGVTIDETGISKGTLRLAWTDVEQLEAPAFGLLDISGAGKTLRLRTYLYDDRIKLLEYIARHTGKRAPELGHSF